MNRSILALLILSGLALSSARAQENDEARKLAEKLTTAGAATFDTKDARAMAAYYVEDALLITVSKDKETGAVKTETKHGRADIEAFYRELFKDGGTIHSKNTVEHARRIAPEILLISGVFEPELGGDLKVPFSQVRVRQGEKWQIQTMQIFLVPKD